MITLQLDSHHGHVPMSGPAMTAPAHDIEDVRANITRLIGLKQIANARALAIRAAKEHPEQEVAWVMLALVCEVQQDWRSARSALEEAMALQQPVVTAGVCFHYVRVLRCLGEVALANHVLHDACALWPEDLALQQEMQAADRLKPIPDRQS